MEFGLFMNGYLPGPASRDTESEHTMLMREIESWGARSIRRRRSPVP